MEEIVSKPWWEFIGVVTGGILAILSLYLALKQHKKKKLVYNIPYLYPLVDIHQNTKSDFEIKYKGEIIEQVCLAEFQIENSGTIPIKKEDFDEPIKIEIKNCKHIFSVELIDTFPDNLTVNIDVKNTSNIILINPMLINPKDFLKFKIIFEGENAIIKVTSRIADLSSIQIKKESGNYESMFIGIAIIAVGFTLWFFPDFVNKSFGTNIVSAGIAFVFASLIRGFIPNFKLAFEKGQNAA